MTMRRWAEYKGAAAANLVRMSSTLKGKAIVFVEGPDDCRLLDAAIPQSDQIYFLAACGWGGVEAACAEMLRWKDNWDDQFPVFFGFVDRDYDGASRASKAHLLTTEHRDIEIDLLETRAGERLLAEKSTKGDDHRAVISRAYEALRTIGLIRKYNAIQSKGWSINDVALDKAFEKDGNCDHHKWISVFHQRNAVGVEERRELETFLSKNDQVDSRLLVRGHDVTALLGIWLRKLLASLDSNDATPNALEEGLRLTTRPEDLQRYDWFRCILQLINQGNTNT